MTAALRSAPPTTTTSAGSRPASRPLLHRVTSGRALVLTIAVLAG